LERKSRSPQVGHFGRITALILVILGLFSLLAACGDPTATPPSAASNPFNQPITPQATPNSTAPADTIPSLVYTGSKELKLSDQLSKDTLANISGAGQLVGNFVGQKANIYVTQDTNDKIEEFYRKLMISSGWSAVNRQADDSNLVLVYQKAGTKLIISVNLVLSTDNLVPELKSEVKVKDRLILIAQGSATQAPPTPGVIPGSPTAEVKTGQKKIATIELEKGGTITAELYPDLAPKSVENFEKLSNKGFYNGLNFHRVEPGFVVQGGDPKGDGSGGPGYTIPGEFAENTAVYKLPDNLKDKAKHVFGSLAMARATSPDSAGSQFYIVIGQETDPSVSGLNGKYAVFGKVSDGMDLVTKIAKGDKIKSIKVEVK